MNSLEEQTARLALLDGVEKTGEVDTASLRSAWVQQYLDWYQVDEVAPWIDEPWPRDLRV